VYESTSQPDNASLVDDVVDLLGSGRAGLVTDVDGTISPIVANPEHAYVLPGARQALQELRAVVTLVAVVSGRSAADAYRMVGIDGLTYIGNHGFEVLSDRGPAIAPTAQAWVPRIAEALEAARARIRQPGILLENKGATASLHYRLAPDHQLAHAELRAIAASVATTSGLRVEEGRMVINLLPPLSISKGSVVSWLAAEHRLERLVYLGDDETDAHAFRALHVLRQSGEVRTLAIAVVDDETPPILRQLADAALPSVDAVSELLCEVSERLGREC
jgi:trehalose 6-phosphate phosphatase